MCRDLIVTAKPSRIVIWSDYTNRVVGLTSIGELIIEPHEGIITSIDSMYLVGNETSIHIPFFQLEYELRHFHGSSCEAYVALHPYYPPLGWFGFQKTIGVCTTDNRNGFDWVSLFPSRLPNIH